MCEAYDLKALMCFFNQCYPEPIVRVEEVISLFPIEAFVQLRTRPEEMVFFSGLAADA